MNAVIEEVIVEPNKIQPIIVNFQMGKPKDDKIQNFSCDLVHDQTQNKAALVISDGQDTYKGYKTEEEKLVRTLLVLHNKKTGKVRLIEAEQWQVTTIIEKPEENIEENKCDDTSWTDKVSSLNKQYGSKKIKRRTEEFEKSKTVIDIKQFDNASNIDEADLSKQPTIESEISFLPPCNKDATNVKDVYNVYDIIPKSILETLYEHATEVLNGDVEGRSKFFKYTLINIQSDPDNVNKVALLLYIEMINTWFNMPIKEMKKRNVVVCQLSEEVNQHVINTYSESTVKGRMRPNIMMDKGLIHTLILALTVSDFILNLELFQGMLKRQISLKKLISLARIIGALPYGKNKNTVALKVPLPAPISLVRKAKKRNSNK